MMMLEMYADMIGIAINETTCTLVFGLQEGGEQRLVVRLPPLVAKELALLLRREVKEHEEKMGRLVIPTVHMQRMKMALEDAEL